MGQPASPLTAPAGLSTPGRFSDASGTGHAPARRSPARQDVDQHRSDEDGAGDDVLPLRGQPQQGHAVGDAAYDQAAEDAVDRPAPSTEEAGAADDGGGDGVKDELAGVARVGAVLAVEERAEQDAGDPGGHGTENKGPRPDRGDPDPGSPRRLGVAADGIDVAAKAGPLEQQRQGAEYGEHDRDHPGHALDGADIRPVDVAEGDHRDPNHRNEGDPESGEACRRSHQAAATPPAATTTASAIHPTVGSMRPWTRL